MDWDKLERSSKKLASNLYGLVTIAGLAYILIYGTWKIRIAAVIAVVSFLLCSCLDPDIEQNDEPK